MQESGDSAPIPSRLPGDAEDAAAESPRMTTTGIDFNEATARALERMYSELGTWLDRTVAVVAPE